MKPLKSTARKVLTVIDAGLTSGVGNPIPGEMCIIAAKRFACDLSHGDSIAGLPVGEAVRSFEISLNDSRWWSSKEARAKGMRRLSVAEWGSDTISQTEFTNRIALKTINSIVPIALQAAAKLQNKEHAKVLETRAKACEGAGDLDAAKATARAASYAAKAASYASDAASAADKAAHCAASAASYDDYVASNASYASAAASAAARAASAASAASYASDAADYAASAAARAAARAAESDRILTICADLAVEVLTEMGCKGCDWLDELCGVKR